MKKLLLKSAFALATLMVSATASAHDFEVDGIFYSRTDYTANTVGVTYKGDSYNSYNEYTGAVTIPSSVTYSGTTYSVTSIDSYAFEDCTGLISVTIPNSVTSIGFYAFYNTGWYNNQADGILYLDNCCLGYKGSKPTGALTLNEGTRLICASAFDDCSSLTSVTIPNSVTSIGFYAFENCSGLTSVTIPNSVTLIEHYAFYGCSGLTSVTIPNSVTSIGFNAFDGCSGLTTIVVDKENSIYDSRDNCNAIIRTATNTLVVGCQNTFIPNSVTSIANSAFEGCTGLTSVTIPNSVTEIGNYVFSGCSGLTTIVVDKENSIYDSRDNCNAIIETATNTLVVGCPNSTIPNSVTSIGDWAFYGCSGLTSVTIPNSVTSIGRSAFSGCSGLTSVTIPNSVTSIGRGAFNRCSGLTSVTIPNSVTSIGRSAFSSCSGLTSVDIPNSVTSIGDRAFEYCPWLLSVISLNPTPPSCGSYVFNNVNFTDATLYVPKDAFAAYFLDGEWGQFANIEKIETLVDSISLSDETLYLNIGDSHTLYEDIIPYEATVFTICWTSDNPLVATVDQYGVVTGVSKGRTTIRARAMDGSEVYSTCMVSVEVATSITLSQTEASLPVNDLMTLSYTILPDELTEKTATWSTSNPGVAGFKENADGSISIVGVSNGVATITATTTDGSNLTASCVIKVGTVGINGIESDDNVTEVARYDIHGRHLSQPTPGINIVKMSNGSTRKEIIK